MSIQSDVEMLFVRALENYEKTHDVTGVEATTIFQNHQIYEKIILQYGLSAEAVERLRYNKVNNQVSFHTEKALKHLYFELIKEGAI